MIVQRLLSFILHLFCGVALAVGLPPLSQIWLVFIALAGVAILNHDLSSLALQQRFWRGFMFGLGYFAFALHWIGFAFLVDAADYLWMMPFAVGGLAMFMALYWGVAFGVAGYLANKRWPVWLVLPVCLAIAEWLRGILLTGFPWAAPGLIADGMGGILQVASLVGMPGLTLLVLLWGMALGGLYHRQVVALGVLATLPACLMWGDWHLAMAPKPDASGPLIRLVQPNISQNDKWRADNTAKIFDDLLQLSASANDQPATVVIWPESAVAFLLDESQAALAKIASILQPRQVLLTGAIRRQFGRDGAETYHTSVELIDSNGVVQNYYDKWRLVPGGEYLPLAWVLEPLGFRKVVNLPESFTAGAGPQSVNVPGIGNAGLLICYEAIFPDQLVVASPRPRWIVNVTNDGWFGSSVGPYQHLAQVRMRAVEQALPIARAANTGISAVIDPWGRYIAKTKLETRDAIEVHLPQTGEPTPFSRWGVTVVWALGGLCWCGVAFFQRKSNLKA